MVKVKYTKKTYERHAWKKTSDGNIDHFAYEDGFHNGPCCTRCYYSFCEHCNPDGFNTPCVVEKFECPKCHRILHDSEHFAFCPTCGEKLDWTEDGK